MFTHRAEFSQPLPATRDRTAAPGKRAPTDAPHDLAAGSLDGEALCDILDGAAFLGAGGGGPKSLGREMIHVLGGNRVPMVSAADVPDEAYVVCSAYIGAPTEALGRTNSAFGSLERAIRRLEASAGINVDYVVPGELGGVNSLAPILSAHDLSSRDLRIPVIDADGCGRAVPWIAATTFGVHDVLATHGAAAANDTNDPAHQQSAVLFATTTSQLQGSIGALVGSPAYGEMGAAALWLMTGAQLKKFAVPSGLSRARELGAALRTASGNYVDVVLGKLKKFGTPGRALFDGSLLKPVSYPQHPNKAHDVGTLVLERQDGKGKVTVYSINENILARASDMAEPVIMVPDMLCWLGEDGSTFDNAKLHYEVSRGTAKPVYAIGVEATQAVGVPSSGFSFRDYSGIEAVMEKMRRAAGYDGKYVPFKA